VRLLVHDFAGHPFAAELSRSLANRGHIVVHGYCGGVTTGRGALQTGPDDPTSLRFVDVSAAPFERYSPLGRLKSELAYGRALRELLSDIRPDAVVSANCPLAAQWLLWRAADSLSCRKVYWLQDFLGRGTRALLSAKTKVLGSTAGRAWEGLETRLLRAADHVVAISPDFLDELQGRGVSTPATVVENWTPLNEVTVERKWNPWSSENQLADRPVAVYSGTLGLKHDPEHLVAAARMMKGTEMILAVVTEGLGRDYLERRKRELQLDNLRLFDFVPYETLPLVLGAADVCLVLLEPEAGKFSAPSKVLSYLAAGRPVVGAIPSDNLAARTIIGAGAGTVVPPGDHRAFARTVYEMLDNPQRLSRMGSEARRYAERTFAIGPIAEQFEVILQD